MSILLSTIHEPFHEHYSSLFGTIRLYAPDADPSEWADLPWTLTTENGGGPKHEDRPPIQVQLKAEYVMEAFRKPYFISDKMLWSPQEAK